MGRSAAFESKLARLERARPWLDRLGRLWPRRPGAAVPPRRIGILLQWGIGDAVLALPLLQGLRAAYPAASIVAIGKPFLGELFDGEGVTDGVHRLVPPWTRHTGKYRPWSKEWRGYLADLRGVNALGLDLVVGTRMDPRESLQLRAITAERAAGYRAAGGAPWITDDLGLDARSYHERYRGEVAAVAARALTGLMPPREPRFKPNPRAADEARAWLAEAGWRGGPVLAIAFGAAHPIRRWSNAKVTATLARLTGEIGACVVIEDGAFADERPIRTPPGVPTAVWRGRLRELKGLLAAADVTFCADSGPMHVAAAAGSRVVALFGPGDLEWFGPPGSRHRVVATEPMPCRPCYDYCIYPTPICMEQIGVAEAAETLGRSLAEVARARK